MVKSGSPISNALFHFKGQYRKRNALAPRKRPRFFFFASSNDLIENRIVPTAGSDRRLPVKTESKALAVPIGKNSVHLASAPNNERCSFVERRGYLVQNPHLAVRGGASGLFREQRHRVGLVQ